MTYTPTKHKHLNELVMDEARHRYSWRGLAITSVTTVVDSQLGFQHMPREMLQDARDRGNEVHRLTAMADLWKPGEEQYVSTPYEAYLQAWWKFLDESKFQVTAVEQKVFDRRHLFCGTLDREGILDDHLTVIDIKSGLVYPEYAWQTAAYQAAANEGRKGDKVTHRAIVQLKADGTYTLHHHTDKHDFQVFLAALLVYTWKGQHNR